MRHVEPDAANELRCLGIGSSEYCLRGSFAEMEVGWIKYLYAGSLLAVQRISQSRRRKSSTCGIEVSGQVLSTPELNVESMSAVFGLGSTHRDDIASASASEDAGSPPRSAA